jgi:hypothetical protein
VTEIGNVPKEGLSTAQFMAAISIALARNIEYMLTKQVNYNNEVSVGAMP